MRRRWWFVLMGLCIVPAALAGTVQLTFDELGTGSSITANNLSISGVTFQFSGGTALYNDSFGTAGNAALVSDPLLTGPTSGILTLNFEIPTTVLQFDIAMFSGEFISGAYTVTLPGGGPLVEDTAPIVLFSEGSFSYTGAPVSSAQVTFSSSAPEFGIDNLVFSTAPEPGPSVLIAGCLLGMSVVMAVRRRRLRTSSLPFERR